MKDLMNFQSEFNEIVGIEKFKSETERYLITLIKDDKSILYEDCTKEEIVEIKNAIMKYSDTIVFINRDGGNPYFRVKFNLYSSKDDSLQFTYEVEYNMVGEFLDEYFLRV